MPTISFLILTYNSADYVTPLLTSLFEKLGKEIRRGSYEIIIVDNASTDETVKQIKNYFSDKKELFAQIKKTDDSKNRVKLYKSYANLGYAGGINLAASFAKGELLVIINPDSEFIHAEFNKIKEEFDNNNKIAIAGLRILSFGGQNEMTAGRFYNPLTFFLYSIGLEGASGLRFSPDRKTKVDFVSGGFVVFRREVFEKLGGYDEEFFMYVEDMDICYRAKKLGFSTYYFPYATIKHRGQASSSREFAIVNIYQGLELFFQKYGSDIEQLYVKNLLSLKAITIIFLGTLFGKKELVSTYMKAYKTIV